MKTTQPVLIAPSVLSADFARLREEVRAVDKGGAVWIHVDVMDGHFMPSRLLESQLDTVDGPNKDEQPLVVDVGSPAAHISEEIIALRSSSTLIGRSAAGALLESSELLQPETSNATAQQMGRLLMAGW